MHHSSWNKRLKGYRKGILKTEETKNKMSNTAQKALLKYKEYKKNGGELKWNLWRKSIKENN